MGDKSKYISSAFLLLVSCVIVKIIGAVYKIPLTAFIGAVGRGYFASAYNLYLPVHAVIMGAFPVAISKLTGKYNALEDAETLSALKKGATRLMVKVGFVGMAVMLLIAKPYCNFIAASPQSLYTVLVLAPSILFCAMAASYRGFCEGFMNMRPTAVSQTLEALFKMVFGLVFARVTMAYLTEVYASTGAVLGTVARSQKEALSLIYPVTSATAMLGVTFGSLVSLAYVVIYDRINRGTLPRCGRARTKSVQGELLNFSFPIMMSVAIQSVFQFLDTATVQYALGRVDTAALGAAYAESIKIAGARQSDLVTYVYGLMSAALDFKNLIPGITMALGVCAVPAVSAAAEKNNSEHLSALINDIYKYTVLLSVLGGVFLAVCSREVLDFFYASSSPDIPVGCEKLVAAFSLTVPFYCLAGSAVFCVQAIGKAQKSIAPYIVSGAVRSFLNILLVKNEKYLLYGAVISGAVGYMIMAIWNIFVVKKYTKTKIDVKNIFVKPTFIALILLIVMKNAAEFVEICQKPFYNLLIESAVCSLLFCILCLLLKSLKLSDIFCRFNCKKNA
ncbi:MAG: oligosaccharide flippase family protein [Eubacterium sp.]|nr:oligosaccharide flippase family protein [Eubacterium sp.]